MGDPHAAWAAIHRSGLDPADEATATPEAFRLTIQHAINAGGDTDTVTAIAGALAGATVGADSIPLGWTRMLNGWGGESVVFSAGELVRLAADAVSNVGGDRTGLYQPQRTLRVDYWKFGDCAVFVRHPHDTGVLLGGVGVLDDLPSEVNAVVSLCRVGDDQVPPRIPRARQDGAFARVKGYSRAPTVAASYAARHRGVAMSDAVAEASKVAPGAGIRPRFQAAQECSADS